MPELIGQPGSAPRALSRPTPKRMAAWCEAGLDAAAVGFFPLLVLAPRGVAALVSLAGLSAAGLMLSAGIPRLRPGLTLTVSLFGCLLVWGTASALWSMDPLRSLVMAARLAGLSAIGLALAGAASSIRAPRRLTRALLAGLALGVTMAALDLLTHGALGAPFTERVYQPAALNQASVSFSIVLLPMIAVLLGGGLAIPPFLVGAATVVTIGALAGTAAKAALLAGLPIGVLLYLSRARAAYVAAILSVLVIVTAPLTFARFERIPALAEMAEAVKPSAGHRLLIWSFAGDRIAERPLVGWGLDSSRAIPGGRDPIRPGETWMPLHPHNAALQLWLELGVPGPVLLGLLLGLAWHALARPVWPRLFAAAAGASLAIALFASLATYGIWQEWWLAALWFLLFAVLVMARDAVSRRGGPALCGNREGALSSSGSRTEAEPVPSATIERSPSRQG